MSESCVATQRHRPYQLTRAEVAASCAIVVARRPARAGSRDRSKGRLLPRERVLSRAPVSALLAERRETASDCGREEDHAQLGRHRGQRRAHDGVRAARRQASNQPRRSGRVNGAESRCPRVVGECFALDARELEPSLSRRRAHREDSVTEAKCRCSLGPEQSEPRSCVIPVLGERWPAEESRGAAGEIRRAQRARSGDRHPSVLDSTTSSSHGASITRCRTDTEDRRGLGVVNSALRRAGDDRSGQTSESSSSRTRTKPETLHEKTLCTASK